MSARIAKRIEIKHQWEASLSPFKNPLLYLRSVLTWQRPIDFGVLLVLFTIGLWAVYSYEVTVLTLVSLIAVTWVVSTFLMKRFNFIVPWNAVLPPQYATDLSAQYYSEIVGLLVDIRCDWADAWSDLWTLKSVNENRFVLQVGVTGVVLAYFGTFISGDALVIITLYILLLIPGTLANSIPQKGFVIVEPYIKVYLDKALVVKDKVVGIINERINAASGKPAAAPVAEPKTDSSPSSAPEDEDHPKHE